MINTPKATLKSKEISIDIEANKGKPIGCPNCHQHKYVGFSTEFGAFRRCLNCRNEWAAGGLSSLMDKSKEEKEFLIELQTSHLQEDALALATAVSEDNERIAQVKEQEKYSGHISNRALWSGWEDLYDE